VPSPPAASTAFYQWLLGLPVVGPVGLQPSPEPGTFSDTSYGCPPNEVCAGYQEPFPTASDTGSSLFPLCLPNGSPQGTPCDLATGSTISGNLASGECDFDGTCNPYFGVQPASGTGTPPTTAQGYRDVVHDNQFMGNKLNAARAVIFGDSVNSKHHQASSGVMCNPPGANTPGTLQDHRKLIGNSFPASPFGTGGGAFDHTYALALARTGWPASAAMDGNPPIDACKNPWNGLGLSPQLIAQTWALQEPDKAKRIVIADGGVNDYPWTDSLATIAACGYLETIAANHNKRLHLANAKVIYTAKNNGMASDVLRLGGVCTLSLRPFNFQQYVTGPLGNRILVGRFLSGSLAFDIEPFAYTVAQTNTISGRVGALRDAVSSWAGKLIWLRYYEITRDASLNATIDIRGALTDLVAKYPGSWGQLDLPFAAAVDATRNAAAATAARALGVFFPNSVQVVPNPLVNYIQGLRTQLNMAIFAGLGCPAPYIDDATGTTDCSPPGAVKTVLFTGVPAGWASSSLQQTVIGGMPHPSWSDISGAGGAAQLGATYKAAYTCSDTRVPP
jgi:hypothetical protein